MHEMSPLIFIISINNIIKMWFDVFNDVFFISISTGLFAFLTVVIKTALKSKCDQTNLCFGCITIHRRVELETDDDSPTASSSVGLQPTASPSVGLQPTASPSVGMLPTPSRSGAVQLNRV